MVKKYSIHILAVTAICPEAFDIPLEQCALISLTFRTTLYLDQVPVRKLIIDIKDHEDMNAPGAISPEQAKLIILFLEKLPDTVTDLYICCSKGGSRSAGCAAAVMRMSGRSDLDVWLNPYYTPNILVYYVLCKEYGQEITWKEAFALKEINDNAFREAKANNGICKYERWQILE